MIHQLLVQLPLDGGQKPHHFRIKLFFRIQILFLTNLWQICHKFVKQNLNSEILIQDIDHVSETWYFVNLELGIPVMLQVLRGIATIPS